MKKVTGAIIGLLVVLAVGIYAGVRMWNAGMLPEFLFPTPEEPIEIINEEKTITTDFVEETLLPASDLVTLTYRYKDASTVSDVKKFFDFEIPLTESKSVFTYTGFVKVGYDLSKVEIDVDNDAKVITLKMPKLEVIANEIDFDSFDFIEDSSSVFNPQTMSENTETIAQLKNHAEANVKTDTEFTQAARENAEMVLTSFLRSAGVGTQYKIVFE